MREVVRKSLFNEMVFFQRAKCMLEDGTIRTGAKGVQQLCEIAGAFSFDKSEMGRRFKLKRGTRGARHYVNCRVRRWNIPPPERSHAAIRFTVM